MEAPETGSDNRYASTAEVAEALGVGISTVKRWVDQGILPAHKTPGGHRKILMSDAARIVREGDFPRRDLARLGLPAGNERAGDPRAVSALVFDALRRGAAEELNALLLGEHRSGRPIAELADTIIAPAMRRLGHEWAEGRLLVWQEHRATQFCMAGLHEIRASASQAEGKRPLAIGGGPEGDPYAMANLLAEMALASHGWEAVNLGPNTPIATIRAALAQLRPRLVWISAGHLADPPGFIDEYRALYREAEKLGTAVAIGGPALTPAIRDQMPCSTYGESIAHLVHFARALEPPAGRPHRGRPPRPDRSMPPVPDPPQDRPIPDFPQRST